MIGFLDIAEFFSTEWQVISGAPVSFLVAVLTVGIAAGLIFGFLVWPLRGWAARSRIDHLRQEKFAEDDVLEIIRAKHEHEVEVREEIEAEFDRLHEVVERLHGGAASSDQLILDAADATERAVEELRRSHEAFVVRMKAWDDTRDHKRRSKGHFLPSE